MPKNPVSPSGWIPLVKDRVGREVREKEPALGLGIGLQAFAPSPVEYGVPRLERFHDRVVGIAGTAKPGS